MIFFFKLSMKTFFPYSNSKGVNLKDKLPPAITNRDIVFDYKDHIMG